MEKLRRVDRSEKSRKVRRNTKRNMKTGGGDRIKRRNRLGVKEAER